MKKRVDPLDSLTRGLPATRATSANAIPRLFTDFVRWCGLTLEPGQYVLARVAFDGVDPRDLPESERELARKLFGSAETYGPLERRYIVAVCGARGGKTFVLIALRMLHLALTVDLSTLGPGEVASAPIVAPDKDLARQAINYIGGVIKLKPELRSMARGKLEETESIDIARDGRVIEIIVRAASAKGQTGRGRSLVGAALDEAAFFRDSDHKVNDAEIYAALSPRVLPGGQLIIASTPWAQVGLLYDMFVGNHPNPECAGIAFAAENKKTALAIHAATLTLRDVPLTRDIVASEVARDKENADREYGAQFMSAGVTVFFDAETIAKSIDKSIPVLDEGEALMAERLPEPGDEVTSGADLGFSKNSSALAVAHWGGGRARLGALVETKPGVGASLKPSEVVRSYAAVLARQHSTFVMADGHYKASAVEYFAEENVGFLDAPLAPADAFIAVRTLMKEGRALFPNHPRLVRQLQEVMMKRTSGGHTSIILKTWQTGEHGDIASAVVLALYQKAGDKIPERREEGDAEEERRDARREQLQPRTGWAKYRPGVRMR